MKASEISLHELGEKFQNFELYISNLKKVSLCCFLLRAGRYYETLEIDFLVKKFDLPKNVVLAVIENMFNGAGPIEKAPIEFIANISDDQLFIAFSNLDIESTFAKYDATIQFKSEIMKESLDSLK